MHLLLEQFPNVSLPKDMHLTLNLMDVHHFSQASHSNKLQCHSHREQDVLPNPPTDRLDPISGLELHRHINTLWGGNGPIISSTNHPHQCWPLQRPPGSVLPWLPLICAHTHTHTAGLIAGWGGDSQSIRYSYLLHTDTTGNNALDITTGGINCSPSEKCKTDQNFPRLHNGAGVKVIMNFKKRLFKYLLSIRTNTSSETIVFFCCTNSNFLHIQYVSITRHIRRLYWLDTSTKYYN